MSSPLHASIHAHSCLHIYVSGLLFASAAVASPGAERTSWARSLAHTCLGEPSSHRNQQSRAVQSRSTVQSPGSQRGLQLALPGAAHLAESLCLAAALPLLCGLPDCSHLQKNLVGEITSGTGSLLS